MRTFLKTMAISFSLLMSGQSHALLIALISGGTSVLVYSGGGACVAGGYYRTNEPYSDADWLIGIGILLDEEVTNNIPFSSVDLESDLKLLYSDEVATLISKDVKTIDEVLDQEQVEAKLPQNYYHHLTGKKKIKSVKEKQNIECALIKNLRDDFNQRIESAGLKNEDGTSYQISVETARYLMEKSPTAFETALSTKALKERIETNTQCALQI